MEGWVNLICVSNLYYKKLFGGWGVPSWLPPAGERLGICCCEFPHSLSSTSESGKEKLLLWFCSRVHFWGGCQQSKKRRSSVFSCLFLALSRFSHIQKCHGSTMCSQAHDVHVLIGAPLTKTLSVNQESEVLWSGPPTALQGCSTPCDLPLYSPWRYC